MQAVISMWVNLFLSRQEMVLHYGKQAFLIVLLQNSMYRIPIQNIVINFMSIIQIRKFSLEFSLSFYTFSSLYTIGVKQALLDIREKKTGKGACRFSNSNGHKDAAASLIIFRAQSNDHYIIFLCIYIHLELGCNSSEYLLKFL